MVGATGRAYESDKEDLDEDIDKPPPLTVPLANADASAIKYLQSSEAVKNLGLFACPDGSTDVQLTKMQDKVEDWTKLVKNGYLMTRLLWTSYTHQLWAGLRYGMCASSTPLLRLAQGLGSSDFYLISSLGVVRTIKKEWRYLPAAFCGMGLYDIMTETTAATINYFLQHYNMPIPIGVTLQANLENLQLELGVPDNPLLYDFSIWGVLATDSLITCFQTS